MSKDIKLGKSFTPNNQTKDAIHVAVAPVCLREDMRPGQAVDVSEGYAFINATKSIGIIDPFIDATLLKAGTYVWLLLHPGTVTDLRHEWTHPAFPEPVEDEPDYDDGCRGC